jgi:hypothetical protein
VIEVREALEETKAFGVRFKPPKSKAGRRDITLPTIVIEALREHRKASLEQRLQLGIGKLPPDALLFTNLKGRPLRPSVVSSNWCDFAAEIGMPEITFPRFEAHARQSGHRRGRRHSYREQATRAREAERDPCDLRPHVQDRRL